MNHTLMADIAAAQRDAGEAMVCAHLKAMGLGEPDATLTGVFETTLFRAVNVADTVICNGYEIDTFDWDTEPGALVACFGYGEIIVVLDQQIQIDADGKANAVDTYGRPLSFEFKVSLPLTAKDMP